VGHGQSIIDSGPSAQASVAESQSRSRLSGERDMDSSLSETLLLFRNNASKLNRDSSDLCLQIQSRCIKSRVAIEESRDLILRANDILRQGCTLLNFK
jgi:hypothetical protein